MRHSDLYDSFNNIEYGLKFYNDKNKRLKVSQLKINLKLFYKKSTFLVD